MKKVCTKCGIEKELDQFVPAKQGKYGRTSRCKVCTNAYMRSWTKKNLEKCRLRFKKWSQKNRENIAKKNKKWNAENKERKLILSKNWKKKNKEKVRSYTSIRNIRLNDTVIKHCLIATGFTKEQIKKHPELIEIRRIIIKTKQLWKTSQNSEKA